MNLYQNILRAESCLASLSSEGNRSDSDVEISTRKRETLHRSYTQQNQTYMINNAQNSLAFVTFGAGREPRKHSKWPERRRFSPHARFDVSRRRHAHTQRKYFEPQNRNGLWLICPRPRRLRREPAEFENPIGFRLARFEVMCACGTRAADVRDARDSTAVPRGTSAPASGGGVAPRRASRPPPAPLRPAGVYEEIFYTTWLLCTAGKSCGYHFSRSFFHRHYYRNAFGVGEADCFVRGKGGATMRAGDSRTRFSSMYHFLYASNCALWIVMSIVNIKFELKL